MDKNVEIATEHYETSNQPYGQLCDTDGRISRSTACMRNSASNGSVRGRKGCTGDSRGDCKLTCCTGLGWT